MERYCRSTFWDPNLTWNTTNPDFTECFEKTALLWSACLFLWITAIFDVYMLANPERGSTALGYNTPTWKPGWTLLSVFKIFLITALVCLEVAVLLIHWMDHSVDDDTNIFAVPDVLWTTPLVLVATHILSAGLIVLHKSHCVHTSGIQLIHWTLLTLVHCLIFRTEYYEYHNPSSDYNISKTALAILGASLTCMILQSFLFCWSDIPEEKHGNHSRLIESSDGISRQECPILRCSCLSYILYSWCTPLVRLGYRRPLTSEDLWSLVPTFTYPFAFKHFLDMFGKPQFGETRSIYRNIIRPLWNTCGMSFSIAITCKLVACLINFASPVVMGKLIDFVQDNSIQPWKGYMWAVVLPGITFTSSLLGEMYFLHMYKCYSNVLTCLNAIIYKKSMSVSSGTRKKTTTGEISNLMSVDVEAIRVLLYQADALWSAPIQIAVAITLLWNQLGSSIFAGIAVIIATVPINWCLTVKSARYQRDQMKKKDDRIKVITEVLSGIQVIKLYAWEPSFQEQIEKIRAEEVTLLRKRAFCESVIRFVLNSVPFVVSVTAFFTYIYLHDGVLSPKKAFTTLILFNLLTDPITEFPASISRIIDARVSFKRVNNFLNAEENHPEATKFLPKDDSTYCIIAPPAIEIVDGTFAWDPIESASWKLTNINLKVPEESLTAIVGSVASGKSSLLAAILGDMKHSGQVTVRGKVAYVPQVAWILNETLRENICFGLPYNKEKYTAVIECCCLTPDFEMLPAGDLTEIGEKGINLSGGQKQRVSLARAAYADADVLLLDDVLSAVDSHVARHIFDKLLGPAGLLKRKTRVLCTHAYQFLPEVDQVVVMENGRIAECGSSEGIMKNSSSFAALMASHVQESESESSPPGQGAQNQSTSTEDDSSKKANSDDISRQDKGKLIKAEHVETGDVQLRIFAEYAKAMRYQLVTLFVFFICLSEGLSFARTFVLGAWTAHSRKLVSSNNGTISNYVLSASNSQYAAGYGALGILQCIFYLIGFLILVISTMRASRVLHDTMLNRILHAPMSFFNVTLLGRITNRFSTDVSSVDKELPSNLGDWICHVFRFAAVIFAISYSTKPYFLLYMIPVTVVYYVLQRYYISCMQQLQRIMNTLRSPIYSQFQETLNGTSTIRAYRAESRFLQMLGRKIDSFNLATFPHLVVRRWLSVRLGALGATVVFVPALFAVLWRGQTSAEWVGVSITYAVQITGIISWLIKVTSYMQYNFVSVERIVEYSEIDQEADFHQGKTECPEKWPTKGEICFDNYETRYRPGLDLVLKKFTCTINPGDKVGIVGRTGAGKSSLSLALFRIIEGVNGKIEIDGVNVADLGLHQVRKGLTVIPQDPVLFSRSLRLNLDPFGDFEDAAVWKALEMAHLKDYVDELEEGLEYQVSEGGENLSVGQRQLVCLARAILRKSPILILDEATASVDSATDALIQKTIREHFWDCTILNVAHRLNTVMDSTRILVLSHGEIVEYESPQALLRNPDSHFFGMAREARIIRRKTV